MVRRQAALALGRISDSKTTEPLTNLASKDEDRWVREAAAESLGRIGDPRAVDHLIESLKDDHYGVRWRAAQALGKIGDPRAIGPLTDLASKDETEAVRKTAKEALEKLGAS